MSQKRLLNFGTTADASKTKEMHQQFFAAQVLRADEPFISAYPPDQILVRPHSVIFDNGLILIEDEIQTFTVETSYNSSTYTIYYEHIDEDIIGGVAASLKLVFGLLPSVSNGVVLGWIVYPGGSVPVSNSMIYSNWKGQITGGQNFRELHQYPNNAQIIAQSASVSMTEAIGMLNQTIPGSAPYILDVNSIFHSNLLIVANQKIRVYNHDSGSDMTRVTTTPSLGQFTLDSSTGIMVFSSADAGKIVDVSDITYGSRLSRDQNGSATEDAVIDRLYTFKAMPEVVKNITLGYIELNDYSVDVAEIVDVNGNQATFTSSTEEVDEGTPARTIVRLTSGAFSSDEGGHFSVRTRVSMGPSGDGIDRGIRASTYDLPF